MQLHIDVEKKFHQELLVYPTEHHKESQERHDRGGIWVERGDKKAKLVLDDFLTGVKKHCQFAEIQEMLKRNKEEQ